jgi:hypothetical protein
MTEGGPEGSRETSQETIAVIYSTFVLPCSLKTKVKEQAWWYLTVIPALQGLRQEDGELEASLGYTVRPCLKTKNKKAERRAFICC